MYTLTPAYGRDYNTLDELKKDFEQDKDFVMHVIGKQTYCNKTDLKNAGIQKVIVRYKNHQKIDQITV